MGICVCVSACVLCLCACICVSLCVHVCVYMCVCVFVMFTGPLLFTPVSSWCNLVQELYCGLDNRFVNKPVCCRCDVTCCDVTGAV